MRKSYITKYADIEVEVEIEGNDCVKFIEQCTEHEAEDICKSLGKRLRTFNKSSSFITSSSYNPFEDSINKLFVELKNRYGYIEIENRLKSIL